MINEGDIWASVGMIIDTTINTSAVRKALELPDSIVFDTKLVEGHLKITANGSGLTPEQLYDAETKAGAYVAKLLESTNLIKVTNIYMDKDHEKSE